MPVSLLSRFVTETIISWHRANPRPMPWKETRDPYYIWLSEIILQQTQVSQGTPYYLKFVEKYPTVYHLAEASEDEVLADWKGLGYNSRARNLHKAAQKVARELDGKFPQTAADLQDLPGVGNYTAAAIASFAYDEAVPVLDTNVIRAICRLSGITAVPNTASSRTQLMAQLDEMIAHAQPSEFNQAMMNFGALVCSAKAPKCDNCPLAGSCIALKRGLVDQIPARAARKPRKRRTFHYLCVGQGGAMLWRKRREKDIWQGMYDFPGFESPETGEASPQQITDFINNSLGIRRFNVDSIFSEKQTLTHQEITAFFYTIKTEESLEFAVESGFLLVENKNLATLATPKLIDCYFRSN